MPLHRSALTFVGVLAAIIGIAGLSWTTPGARRSVFLSDTG